MDDIFSFLNLDKNASREELKAAFVAWKKSRQQILKNGTREEQTQAANEISTMTTLYKEACDNFKISNGTNQNLSQNENVPPPLDDRNLDGRNIPTELNRQKILNIALCFVILILSGVIFYLYDKNSSKPVVVQTTPQRNENYNTSNNISHIEKIPAVEPVENKPKQDPKNAPVVADKNVGKTPAQRGAIQTLLDFHENITKKSFPQAYNCMSYELQDKIPYEGWVRGFRTTVSSVPSNIKIAFESSDKIILTYDLTAIDNPGGTTTFSGTIEMIKTLDTWKIYDVRNIQR